MNKYIIKNCPAFMKPSYCKDKCSYSIVNQQDGELTYKFEFDESSKCQDCTDCIMKQIVELCKETCRKRCTNYCLGAKKYFGYGQILELLDIQEVE